MGRITLKSLHICSLMYSSLSVGLVVPEGLPNVNSHSRLRSVALDLRLKRKGWSPTCGLIAALRVLCSLQFTVLALANLLDGCLV